MYSVLVDKVGKVLTEAWQVALEYLEGQGHGDPLTTATGLGSRTLQLGQMEGGEVSLVSDTNSNKYPPLSTLILIVNADNDLCLLQK